MSEPFKEYDVVALLEDLPQHKLLRGQVGTIVMVYEPGAFEVDFVDREGFTYALVTLLQDQLMLLHFDPTKDA